MAKKKTTKKKTTAKKKTTKKKDEYDTTFLTGWARKMKRPVEVLEAELQAIAVELQEKHGERWTKQKCFATARRNLYGKYKNETRSSAAPWGLAPLYAGDPFDYGARRYKANIDAHSKNPAEAKKKKLVRIDRDSRGKKTVIPIDERPKTKAGKDNRNFGKPLPEHAYIMTIGGLGAPLNKKAIDEDTGESFLTIDDEKLRPFEMTISGRLADPTGKSFVGAGFDLGKWYKSKATNKTSKDNEESWELNATTVTKWNLMEDLELDLDSIPEHFANFYVPLGELQEYHDSFMEENADGTRQFCNRIVVTEGQVIDIIESDNDNNHRMLIDDESLGFGDDDSEDILESVNCWINPNFEFGFGKYSTVIMFGKTSASLKKDMATNEVLDEMGRPSIQVSGIIVKDLVEPEDIEDESGGTEDNHEAEGTVDPIIDETDTIDSDDDAADETEEEDGKW